VRERGDEAGSPRIGAFYPWRDPPCILRQRVSFNFDRDKHVIHSPSGTEEAFRAGAIVSVYTRSVNCRCGQLPRQHQAAPGCCATRLGGGHLTERASSDVGSLGLDRVERRLRAEAANIPHYCREVDVGYEEGGGGATAEKEMRER